MKQKMRKVLACVLVFAMAVALGGVAVPRYVQAAEEPAFSCTKKTVAVGGTYTLEVEGISDTKASYSWSSSATKVAVVSSKGVITGISEGTATIKCKVTLSDKSTKTLSCAVTVKEHKPASSVTINNAQTGTLNAHTIKVGATYDFNRTLSPSGSNDKTYWYIQDEEYATVDSNGVVTALKPGITMLIAKSGIDRVAAEELGNTVTDYVYLYILPSDGSVVTPTPTPTPGVTVTPTPTPTVTPTPTPTPTPVLGDAAVSSVTLASYKELRITFGQPVVESSVVNADGSLTGYISIAARSASLEYGDLTGKLSEDGLTLSIYASNGFDGTYYIAVSSGIKTTTGKTIATYGEYKRLSDETGPYCLGVEIDAKGYINRIRFSEPVDISKMEIVGVETSCEEMTKATLTELSNYVLSEDKTELEINLGFIEAKDENKDLLVVINGICDLAGNFTTPYSLKLTLRADTNFRAVASVVSVERVSMDKMVVTFDDALLDAGEMTVGGYTVAGAVNPENEYQGIYLLTDAQMRLSGNQVVTVEGWYSYFAAGAASTPYRTVVDFTPSVTNPKIVQSVISQTTVDGEIITSLALTYDKEVIVLAQAGSLAVVLDDNSGYIIPKNVIYSASSKGKVVTITVSDSQMSTGGSYKITIPAYFAMDAYMNYTKEETVRVSVNATDNTKLPAPYQIEQDTTNPSVLYVRFSNMLDKTSAQTITNYILANAATPLRAELTEQTQSGATVKLTFASKAIQYNGTYPLTVRNLKGYGDSLAEMDAYTGMIYLLENTPPVVGSAKMVSANEVVLSFTDSSVLTGMPDFVVTLPGSSKDICLYSYLGENNTVCIALSSNTSGYVIIKPTVNCDLKDANGNAASLEESYTAVRSY